MSFAQGWGKKTGCLGRQLKEIADCKQNLYYTIKKTTIMSKGILSQEEIGAAKEAGINLQQFWAVAYDTTATPLAIFDSRENAEKWKSEMCATAIVEPYALQVR